LDSSYALFKEINFIGLFSANRKIPIGKAIFCLPPGYALTDPAENDRSIRLKMLRQGNII